MKNRKSILYVFLILVLLLATQLPTAFALQKQLTATTGEKLSRQFKGATNDQELSANATVLQQLNVAFYHSLKSSLNNTLFLEKARQELLKRSTPDRLIPLFMAQLTRLSGTKGNVRTVHSQLHKALATRVESSSGGISGKITVAGQPPSNDVLVLAFDQYGYFGGEAVAAKDDGHYTIDGLSNGSYYVVTWSRHFVDEIYDDIAAPLTSLAAWRQATLVPVSVDAITEDIDFDLQTGALIKGTIYREDGTTPLQDETIDLAVTKTDVPSPILQYTMMTTDGRYEIVVPYKGDVKVAADADAYLTTWYPDQTNWANAQTVTIPDYNSTVSDVNFTLQPDSASMQLGSIEGKVKLEGQFMPPFMSIVMAFNLADSSFANLGLGILGPYSITDLQPGQYFVYGNDYMGNLLGSTNYLGEFYDGVHSPDEATPVTVNPSESTSGIDFSLDPGGAISGKVTDSAGNPLDSLMVVAFDAELGGPGQDPFLTRLQIAASMTDEQGNYKMTGLPSGAYILRTVSDFSLDLQKLNTGKGKHAGEVVDEYYGGVANLFDIKQAVPVEVTVPNETEHVDFQLSAPHFFSGKITDAVSGEPVTDLTIVALNDTSAYPYLPVGEIDSTGGYRIGPLPEGNYKILALVGFDKDLPYLSEFYDGSRNFHSATVLQLHVAEYGNVDITLDRGATIQGFVQLSEGLSAGADTLKGFPVVAFDATTGALASYCYVQFSGGFRLRRLFQGSYKVMAFPVLPPFATTYLGGGDTFDDGESQTLTLNYGEKEETTITLEQASGSISGRVYNAATMHAIPQLMVIAYDESGHAVSFGMTDMDLQHELPVDLGGTFVISGLRTGNYYLRTFALSTAFGSVDNLTGLLDMGETTDNPFDLLGGGFGTFNFSFDVYKDVWFPDIETKVKIDLNDLLFKMAAYGMRSDYEDNLTPIFIPLPFAARIPDGATPVSVTDGMTTSGINIGLNPGDVRDLFTDVPNQNAATLPEKFMVEQNYPNPFNPSTTITFAVPFRLEVQIQIYDALGRYVGTLLNDVLPAGVHRVAWQGQDATGQEVPAGLYFARVQAGSYHKTIKMLLIK